jgi:L-threonylcarbamoyladenylate synthase
MTNIPEAVTILQHGGVVAYPTEAVYGLGCDPMNPVAVEQLLQLKHRSVEKGLILIASAWEQVAAYTAPVSEQLLAQVYATWPGPVTWVFPAAASAPKWITGRHAGIAVRVTVHPVASELCRAFGGALVSTSANVDGQAPAMSAKEVGEIFSGQVDLIVEGEIGDLGKPTEIRDVVSGKVLRR